MFGSAALDHMPDAFLTDPAAWDGFVGQVWHAVLTPLALKRHATVIEIAPGSAAKIGHALAAQDFAGNLHIVEASTSALELLADHYRSLLPEATLHLHAAALADCLVDLPHHADAVLGNHIIDDMLLHAAAPAESATFNWATHYSDAIAPETRQAFHHLQQQGGESARLIADVSSELAQMIAVVRPRHVVLSQYPSSTLQDNGLDALNTCASKVLEQLKSQLAVSYIIHDCTVALNTLPHYHNAHIGLNVLNPQHWLSCTRKT